MSLVCCSYFYATSLSLYSFDKMYHFYLLWLRKCEAHLLTVEINKFQSLYLMPSYNGENKITEEGYHCH